MNPFLKFREIAEKFPEAKAPPSSSPDGKSIIAPDGQTLCACGKKYIPASEVKIVRSPYCIATDNICNECVGPVKNHSLIVCTKCKTVAARLAPHQDKSGFRFEPCKPYHTPFCPNCAKNCVSSPIAEKAVWDEEQRRK